VKTKLFYLTLIIAAIPVLCTTIIDSDIWWHMQHGKDLIINQSVDYSSYYWTKVTTNQFALRFTALGDMILYLAHYLGGNPGLVSFRCMMMMVCVVSLFLCSDRKPNGFKLLIFVGLIIGTYQTQLLRNSIFSLALLPLLLYLFEQKKYVSMGVTVVLWNFLHGSYLMGFGIMGILFFSDAVDTMTDGKRFKNIWIHLSILIITFSIIAYKNPMTTSYASIPRIAQITTSVPNQSVFQPGKDRDTSIDFLSPFKIKRTYIRCSFIMGLLTLMLVRPRRAKYLLPFLTLGYFGVGYVRMVGYIAIISTYTLMIAEKNNDLRYKLNDWLPISLALLIIFAVYTEKLQVRFPMGSIGFDKNIMYTTKCANLSRRYKRTFTTLTNGGFLLYHWYPHKKVSIDTHWAPHPKDVMEATKSVVFNADPVAKIADSALLCHANRHYVVSFAKSKLWHVAGVDRGMVLFTTEKVKPQLLYTQEEYDSMRKVAKLVLHQTLATCNIKVKGKK